jgi:hypothetical protein
MYQHVCTYDQAATSVDWVWVWVCFYSRPKKFTMIKHQLALIESESCLFYSWLTKFSRPDLTSTFESESLLFMANKTFHDWNACGRRHMQSTHGLVHFQSWHRVSSASALFIWPVIAPAYLLLVASPAIIVDYLTILDQIWPFWTRFDRYMLYSLPPPAVVVDYVTSNNVSGNMKITVGSSSV